MTTQVIREGGAIRVIVDGEQGLQGNPGPTGPSNNTRATLVDLKASAVTDLTSLYDGSLWFWTLGDFASKIDDATIVKSNSVGASIGAWVRQIDSVVLTPEMYGAKGDGIADDTVAFNALNAAIAANNGACVQLRAGAVYIGGNQLPNVDGIRFKGFNLLEAKNVAYFILNMNGATLKMKGGLRFGGFDAAGNATTASTNYDAGQRADQMALVSANNVGLVEIRNGTLDGNGAAAIVGGIWGDTGRQCVSYGVSVANCGRVMFDGLLSLNFLLDCYSIAAYGQTTAAKPQLITMRGCIGRNAGRNVVSLIGTNAFQADQCSFENAGYCANATAPGGFVVSSPASCFDVEAEGTTIKNPTFVDTSFIAGQYSNTCFVTASGDSSGHYFLRCRLHGNTFIQKPGVKFIDCEIGGKFGALWGTGDADSTTFIRCHGGDNSPYLTIPGGGLFMDGEGAGVGVRLIDCDFTLFRNRLNARNMTIRGGSVRIAIGTGSVANQDYAILTEGASLRDWTIIDAAGSADGNLPTYLEGYYVLTDPTTRADNVKITGSPRFTVKWNTWSTGGGGYPSPSQSDGSFSRGAVTIQRLRLTRGQDFGGGYDGWATLISALIVPDANKGALGDVAFHATPSAINPLAWTFDGSSWRAKYALEKDTGWTAGTGTALKGAFASYTGQTQGGSYNQAAAQSLDDAVRDTSQRVLALEQAFRALKSPN